MFWRRAARINDQYSNLMNKEDSIKEKFKQALQSTYKVIADDYKVVKNHKKMKNHIILEKLRILMTKTNLKVRAETDSDALKKIFKQKIIR